MSGKSRSTSATVGTNSTASASAAAPLYATRALPWPLDCSSDARASAAPTSASTIKIRGISRRGRRAPRAVAFLERCALTAVRSARTHGPRMLVTRFEALDLPFGFVARDAIGLFNRYRKARALARNGIKVRLGQSAPVGAHLAPESLPAGFHKIPVHLQAPAFPWLKLPRQFIVQSTTRRCRHCHTAIASSESVSVDRDCIGSWADRWRRALRSCRLGPDS